jgi:Ni,Fe-hydrogenase III large subunit
MKIIDRLLGRRKKEPNIKGDRLIRTISDMVGVRQDIQELARKVEERTRRLDLLIDQVIDEMKHRRILETRRVR